MGKGGWWGLICFNRPGYVAPPVDVRWGAGFISMRKLAGEGRWKEGMGNLYAC